MAAPCPVRQRGEGAGTRPGEQTGCRGGVPFRVQGGRLQPVSGLTLGAREEEGARSLGWGRGRELALPGGPGAEWTKARPHRRQEGGA